MSVDLPAPFSPTMPRTWPARSSRLTSWSTRNPTKLLDSPLTFRSVRPSAVSCTRLLWHDSHPFVDGSAEVDGCRYISRRGSLRPVRPSDVFELLRDGQPRTRSQLAHAAGMSRSTIAARIEVLMRLGLIAPYGEATSTGGRPPSLLALNLASHVVAGIDIGASHTSVALADLAGVVLAERRADLDV